jgi:hypothetical protein
MKKIFSALALVLAVNFLAEVGGIAYLFKEGKLDREKVTAIKQIVFPPPATQPTTQAVEFVASPPTLKLEELLAQYAGRPPAEQLEHIRASFDSQTTQLERSVREFQSLKQQVEDAQRKVEKDRAAMEARAKALDAREKQAEKLAGDKGFQDALAMYQSMPSKQVKTVFMGLDDATVVQFLQAMEPRAAAKITKEFKSAEEAQRLAKLLERLRQPQAAAKE